MDRLSSELLGFATDARVLIVNCDDFGMHDAVNAAVVESIENGIASSCSLMVPCPAAANAIGLLRERPHIPFGIHLALPRSSPHLKHARSSIMRASRSSTTGHCNRRGTPSRASPMCRSVTSARATTSRVRGHLVSENRDVRGPIQLRLIEEHELAPLVRLLWDPEAQGEHQWFGFRIG